MDTLRVDGQAVNALVRRAAMDHQHAPLGLDKTPMGLGGREEFLARLREMGERASTPGCGESEKSENCWRPPTEERVRELLRESRLQPEERSLSLDTVLAPQGSYRHQERSQMVLRQFVGECAAGRQERRLPDWWVCLCSRAKGTGKSHLAMAAAADLCRLGIPTVHVWELDMLRMLRDSQGDRAEFGLTQLQALWLKPAVLVLDELGDEMPTEFSAREQYRLIEARVRRRRPTIITTNLTEDMLIERYARARCVDQSERDGMRDQGERIVSRIYGACLAGQTWIRMEGPDLRAEGRTPPAG